MLPTTILAVTGLIALSFAAPHAIAPRATNPPLQITNLSIDKVVGGNVTITLTVYDPDPLTLETTECGGTWKTGSKGFPTETYQLCNDNTTFAWHMESFKTVKSFELGFTHNFEDPAVGDPPQDHVTNFAKTYVAKPQIECTTTGREISCKQEDGTVIEAPVYASIAR